MVRNGLTFPFAPAPKTMTAWALSSATYKFPELSTAKPTGLTSIVLLPEISAVGATLPRADDGYSVMLCPSMLPTNNVDPAIIKPAGRNSCVFEPVICRVFAIQPFALRLKMEMELPFRFAT